MFWNDCIRGTHFLLSHSVAVSQKIEQKLCYWKAGGSVFSISVFVQYACVFQNDRFQSGIPADLYRSKPQISAQKSPPSSFSSLSSFQPVQKQRPPANQLLATQAEGDLLLGALRQYLSGHASLHSGGASPFERLRTFYSNRIENSGLKKETSKSRLVNMGRPQGALPKDPLTSVDGMYFTHDGFHHRVCSVFEMQNSRQDVFHFQSYLLQHVNTHMLNCQCCQILHNFITSNKENLWVMAFFEWTEPCRIPEVVAGS